MKNAPEKTPRKILIRENRPKLLLPRLHPVLLEQSWLTQRHSNRTGPITPTLIRRGAATTLLHHLSARLLPSRLSLPSRHSRHATFWRGWLGGCLDAEDTRGGRRRRPLTMVRLHMVPAAEDLDRRRAARAGSTRDCQGCFGEFARWGYVRLSGVLQVLVEIPIPSCCLNWSGRGCTTAAIAGTMPASMTISSPRLPGDERE
jgi:hypothetical protein